MQILYNMKIKSGFPVFIFQIGLLIMFMVSCTGQTQTNEAKNAQKKYNVLFIAVDDLRPQLGCYGETNIHSPNIDKLASTGYVFTNAYCQVPVCGASRSSLLTGLLPRPNRFISYAARMDKDAPGITTLPMHFKNNGYYTVNYGKVSHWPNDQEESWSEEPLRPDWHKLADGSWSYEGWHDYQTEHNQELDKTLPKKAGLPYEKAAVHDSAYADGKTIKLAISKLEELKQLDQPFFFGVGILKPHLPFNAPQKYWDLYSEDDIELAPNPVAPRNAPKEGIPNWGELRAYAKVPESGPVSDSLNLKLIHGYYACVSYVDALIGDLLVQLEKTGLDKNTIIVLWSDHGYFLGEHGFWCKHSLYELATRVPLIIKIPENNKPQSINTTVELIDLFPTLCEMTNLPLPEHLQGKSFTKAFENPNYLHKDYAYSRFFQGESINKDGFRYTCYYNNEDNVISEMLYNLQTDPNENSNISSESDFLSVKKEYNSIIDKIRNNK